jgi:hypothetical protein
MEFREKKKRLPDRGINQLGPPGTEACGDDKTRNNL